MQVSLHTLEHSVKRCIDVPMRIGCRSGFWGTRGAFRTDHTQHSWISLCRARRAARSPALSDSMKRKIKLHQSRSDARPGRVTASANLSNRKQSSPKCAADREQSQSFKQAIELDARRTKGLVSHAAGGHHVSHYSARFKARVVPLGTRVFQRNGGFLIFLRRARIRRHYEILVLKFVNCLGRLEKLICHPWALYG